MDPEVLDPDRPADAGAPNDTVGLVERAFKGHVVRTMGTRIEIAGPAGPVVVLQTPVAALVIFRGWRAALDANPEKALALLESIARGTRALVEEHGAGSLRRTHLVRTDGDAFIEVEDTTNDKAFVPKGALRVVTFASGEREASKAERAFIKKHTGGLVGRVKRKVVETVIDKALGALKDAADQAAQANAPREEREVTVDDGSRKLGPGER